MSIRTTAAAIPMKKIPLELTRRSDRLAKRDGTQRSSAMYTSTRGPPRNPVCAATNKSAPADNSKIATNALPTWLPGGNI